MTLEERTGKSIGELVADTEGLALLVEYRAQIAKRNDYLKAMSKAYAELGAQTQSASRYAKAYAAQLTAGEARAKALSSATATLSKSTALHRDALSDTNDEAEDYADNTRKSTTATRQLTNQLRIGVPLTRRFGFGLAALSGGIGFTVAAMIRAARDTGRLTAQYYEFQNAIFRTSAILGGFIANALEPLMSRFISLGSWLDTNEGTINRHIDLWGQWAVTIAATILSVNGAAIALRWAAQAALTFWGHVVLLSKPLQALVGLFFSLRFVGMVTMTFLASIASMLGKVAVGTWSLSHAMGYLKFLFVGMQGTWGLLLTFGAGTAAIIAALVAVVAVAITQWLGWSSAINDWLDTKGPVGDFLRIIYNLTRLLISPLTQFGALVGWVTQGLWGWFTSIDFSWLAKLWAWLTTIIPPLQFLETIFLAIVDAVKQVVEWISKISIPGWLQSAADWTERVADAANDPQRARDVAEGLANMTPPALYPPPPPVYGQITHGAYGPVQTQPISINIYGDTYGTDDFVSKVEEAISEGQRRGYQSFNSDDSGLR